MNDKIHALIQCAQAKLDVDDRTGAELFLSIVEELDAANLDAHNLREKHLLNGNYSSWMGVKAEISPDDDIFRFFANHPTSKNPLRDYLSDGWRTMVELQDVLDMHGLSLRQCRSFLEFASGQGRFTRHLARIFTAGQLSVSDVVPGSVDFLKATLGVKGFYSSTKPEEVVFPEKYDQIFVLSLFSHLPVEVWGRWLKALYGALAPKGVLVFSTHGVKCAHLAGIDLGADAYKFFASSESTVLDGETYGSAYATAEYVKNAVANALGTEVFMQVVPSHFWGNQDAVVVMR